MPTPAAGEPLRLAFVASQDPRVAENGVNTHSRHLKAALAALGQPFTVEIDPIAAHGGARRLLTSRLVGRLGGDRDRRAARDFVTRRAILMAAVRQDDRVAAAHVLHAQDVIAATACLDALGGRCPPLVLAHHVNGLPDQELAQRLGLGPDAESVRLYAAAMARAVAAAARVVAVSAWAGSVLQEAAGLAATKVAVVPNGVPVPLEPPPDAARVPGRVVAVGQLVERKGLDVLIEAVARVRADPHVPSEAVHAVIVGDGPMRTDLAERARRLGAPITFRGALASAEVARELSAATLFALPSRAENLPMALLEAMAAGLPCVASAVGGVAEALAAGGDSAAGLTVPAGDVAALAEALGRLLSDREGRQAMGRRAHARALAHYGTATMAERWLTIYREAAASGGPG